MQESLPGMTVKVTKERQIVYSLTLPFTMEVGMDVNSHSNLMKVFKMLCFMTEGILLGLLLEKSMGN